MKAIFTKIDENETRLDYKGHKFLIIEQDRGVYSMGRAIQLYRMQDFEKIHIKELGWTRTDNCGGPDKSNAYLKGVVSKNQCEEAAIKYIDSII